MVQCGRLLCSGSVFGLDVMAVVAVHAVANVLDQHPGQERGQQCAGEQRELTAGHRYGRSARPCGISVE